MITFFNLLTQLPAIGPNKKISGFTSLYTAERRCLTSGYDTRLPSTCPRICSTPSSILSFTHITLISYERLRIGYLKAREGVRVCDLISVGYSYYFACKGNRRVHK